jgi:hypothetical protein
MILTEPLAEFTQGLGLGLFLGIVIERWIGRKTYQASKRYDASAKKYHEAADARMAQAAEIEQRSRTNLRHFQEVEASASEMLEELRRLHPE